MRTLLVTLGIVSSIAIGPSGTHAEELLWARQLQGATNDYNETTTEVAVDAAGNVYVVGGFQDTVDFDSGPGTFNLTPTGGIDAFVLKLDSSGALVWARRLGGLANDAANSVAVDGSGNVYTVGSFQGTADFDPGLGTSILTSSGVGDAFVSKLDSAGNFVWVRQIAGTMEDHASRVELDATGNVYTAGWFLGTTDFDPSAATFNLTSFGATDAFVVKLSSAGAFVWARQFGGTSSDYAEALAIGPGGTVHTVGWFRGTADFDPGPGVFNVSSASAGFEDVYVSKLDTSGNFLWAKALGGASSDYAQAVAVDAAGNVYTPGNFHDTADLDPGPGTFNLTSAGDQDIFLSKLDSAGNFVWAKQLGGISYENSIAVAVAGGNVYTVGHFQGAVDFDPGSGTFGLTSVADSGDAFVWKVADTGAFGWAGQLGGLAFDAAISVAVGAGGTVHAIGNFSDSADFDPGPFVHYLASKPGSGIDGFVVKLGLSAPNAAGAVPDGNLASGTPLTIGKGGGTQLNLDWDFSCHGGDVNYEVYEGTLGVFTSHVPLLCSTAGATAATVTASSGNRYYLLVPNNGSVEGSYGRDRRGVERAPSSLACMPQSLSCP